MKKKPLSIHIDWKFLERIAEYYEFPVAVFLGNKKLFKHKTRSQSKIKLIDFLEASESYDGELFIKNGAESQYSFCWDNDSHFTVFSKKRYSTILNSYIIFVHGNIELQDEFINEILYDEFMCLCAGYIPCSFYDKCIQGEK